MGREEAEADTARSWSMMSAMRRSAASDSGCCAGTSTCAPAPRVCAGACGGCRGSGVGAEPRPRGAECALCAPDVLLSAGVGSGVVDT